MTDAQPQTSSVTAAAPSRAGSAVPWVAGPLALAGGLGCLWVCLCLALAGVVVWRQGSRTVTERPRTERVLDAFMEAMLAGDADAAYALFSTRAQAGTPRADLDALLLGDNFVLFAGYRAVAITDFSLSLNRSDDPHQPQGTVAQVEGRVIYDGDFTGDFSAVLELEEDEWRLFWMHIDVPPEKIDALREPQG